MSQGIIQSELIDNIFHVRICREEKRNALTAEMLCELGEVVSSVDQYQDARAVIVSAEGPIFCAGIDVFSLGAAAKEAGGQDQGRWLRRLAERMQYALHQIEATELPVIGALQGQVIGMGLELALSFDLRVTTEDCLFSIPETRLGLVADVGGTTRLARTVGPSRAKDLLMTARVIDAQEALNWGLVNRVSTADQVMQTATELAQQIAQNSALAVGMSKLIIDQGCGLDKHTQMSIERWAQSQLITSEDLQKAVQQMSKKKEK